MKRCSRCHARMVIKDDERIVCMACGEVFSDEVDTLTKMLSNASLEEPNRHHGRRAKIDIKAVTARVLAAVRAEAGR